MCMAGMMVRQPDAEKRRIGSRPRVAYLILLLLSAIALHLPCSYADEVVTLDKSKLILAKLINEMLICERVSEISLVKTVSADIHKIHGSKELPKISLTGETGKIEGWINVYTIREIYAGLEVTEIRQSVSPVYKTANLWIAFEALMPTVKETLKSQLEIEFKDDDAFDAMPDRQVGDIFAFYEGTNVTVELNFFSANPGKIYLGCRRNPQ